MSTKEEVHSHSIDYLRLLSILAVIMIHTSIRTIQASSNNLADFKFSLLLNQLSGFAVPLFFLISGFVLELNYNFHQNYLTYLYKRLSKILVPYVFWSAIFYYFVYPDRAESFIGSLFYGTASYQLYFIPALITFYLVFPLIHQLYSIFARKWVLYLLLILQVYLLYLDYYLHPLTIYYPIRVALFNFFVFIFGMVASHHQHTLRKYSFYPLALMLGIYITYEGITNFYSTGNYLAFYSQWRPSIFLYSLALFSFLYHYPIASPIIKKLSKLSFLVYFIHVIILELVWKLVGSLYQFPGFDILYFALVTSISFSLAYLLHRIPKLHQIIG